MTAVLLVAVGDERGTWLLEAYADADTLDLDDVAPALRLLAAHAVRPSADS